MASSTESRCRLLHPTASYFGIQTIINRSPIPSVVAPQVSAYMSLKAIGTPGESWEDGSHPLEARLCGWELKAFVGSRLSEARSLLPDFPEKERQTALLRQITITVHRIATLELFRSCHCEWSTGQDLGTTVLAQNTWWSENSTSSEDSSRVEFSIFAKDGIFPIVGAG